MGLNQTTGPELAELLRLYDVLDELAHDLSGGVDHQVILAELWGFVKALGKRLPYQMGNHPAYCLCSADGAPRVVVESDGSIMDPAEWEDAVSSKL